MNDQLNSCLLNCDIVSFNVFVLANYYSLNVATCNIRTIVFIILLGIFLCQYLCFICIHNSLYTVFPGIHYVSFESNNNNKTKTIKGYLVNNVDHLANQYILRYNINIKSHYFTGTITNKRIKLFTNIFVVTKYSFLHLTNVIF